MNLDMDVKYKSHLDEWESDPNVKCVLADSCSARAFCGGGDVKQITAKNQPPNMIEVFTAEYSLSCEISENKKPYISFMDGGLWCWPNRSRSLPDHYREDCSCYARECNLFVPSCWVFTYSGKESRRRICRKTHHCNRCQRPLSAWNNVRQSPPPSTTPANQNLQQETPSSRNRT